MGASSHIPDVCFSATFLKKLFLDEFSLTLIHPLFTDRCPPSPPSPGPCKVCKPPISIQRGTLPQPNRDKHKNAMKIPSLVIALPLFYLRSGREGKKGRREEERRGGDWFLCKWNSTAFTYVSDGVEKGGKKGTNTPRATPNSSSTLIQGTGWNW